MSFDVLGTCFTFDKAIKVVEDRCGSKLQQHGIDAKSLVFSWFYAAQRDFTYCSMAGSYTPIATVLQKTFKRAGQVIGAPSDLIMDEDVSAVMAAIRSLEPVEGLKECWDGLRQQGWDLYAVTNGGRAVSAGYYKSAGIDLDEDHLLSCDDIQRAKPDPLVYQTTHERILSRSAETADRWFVAAHSWDLIAARKAGFRTAWLDYEEHDPVTDVFGEFDIYASSMKELLTKINALPS